MIHILENDKLRAKIEDHGAELKSIFGKNGNFEYLWHGSPDYWNRSAIILFPVCGRLFKGKYVYDGKEYEMNIHGFAKDSDFSVTEKKTDKIVFELKENAETLKQYPFKFLLKVTYTLVGATIKVSVCAFNTGNEDLPFSLGGHPGFSVPLEDGLTFSDHYIEFSNKGLHRKNVFSSNGLDLGETIDYELKDDNKLMLTHELFDDDALFFIEKDGYATLKSDKTNRFVKVSYKDVTHLGIWQTRADDTPFVCIEPWHGVPADEGVTDDFATKKEFIHLKNGESYEFSFDITVSE